MQIKHAKVSLKPDGADTTVVRPSDWNAYHVDENGGPIYAVISDPGPGEYRVVNIRIGADKKIIITYEEDPQT